MGVALARSLFARGPDFTATIAFELASTNLVVELQGIVLAIILGWEFTVGEFEASRRGDRLEWHERPRRLPRLAVSGDPRLRFFCDRRRADAADDQTVPAGAHDHAQHGHAHDAGIAFAA